MPLTLLPFTLEIAASESEKSEREGQMVGLMNVGGSVSRERVKGSEGGGGGEGREEEKNRNVRIHRAHA